ncbi:alpha/beta hydrolase [Aspergillus lucknowensis]|uniref:Alpha/Beta hydrolase protein n=1 Tax=Aspergillus lucknowensis TaxID=176173 RepID=A0ABR4LYS4_9EURO
MGDSSPKEVVQQQTKHEFKDELLALGRPDPEYKSLFVFGLPSSGGFATDPIDVMRDFHFNLEKKNYDSIQTPGTQESVGKIPMRDGYESEIRIFRPSLLPEDGSPLVVLIFGGGFLAGTNMQHVPFARALTSIYSATTITISYRRAPEHPFPFAPNDAWDSVKWIAQHATLLGADPSKGFILGGVSAGGNLTAVTAQRAVKEKLSPPLTGIWVSIPPLAVDAKGIPEEYRVDWVSRIQNASAPILDVRDIDICAAAYKPDLSSENFSPFVNPDVVPQLPPAYVQVVGMDPLRDDGLIYERYLKDHGVKTRLDVYPGVPHCHYAFHPGLALSKKFEVDVKLGVGWLLGRDMKEAQLELSEPRWLWLRFMDSIFWGLSKLFWSR